MARTKVSTLQSPDHDAFTRVLARDLRAHEWINEIDERDGIVPPSVPLLLESAAPVPSPRPATSFPVHITTVAALCTSCAGEAKVAAGARSPSRAVVPLDEAPAAPSFGRLRPSGATSGELAPAAQPAVVALQEQPQPVSPRSPRPPHRQLTSRIPVILPSAPFPPATPKSASDVVGLGTSAPVDAPLHSTLHDLLNPPSTARPPTAVPIPAIQVQPPTSEDLFGDGGVSIVPLERDDSGRDNRPAPRRSSSLSSLPSTSQGTSEHTRQGSHASEVGETLEAGPGVQRPSEDRTSTMFRQSRKRKSSVVEPSSPQKAPYIARPLAERKNGAERNRHGGGGTLSAQSSSGSFDLPFQLPSS